MFFQNHYCVPANSNYFINLRIMLNSLIKTSRKSLIMLISKLSTYVQIIYVKHDYEIVCILSYLPYNNTPSCITNYHNMLTISQSSTCYRVSAYGLYFQYKHY